VPGIWGDRVAEVWAAPGSAGSGVVVGTHSVLTAWHVVAKAEPEGVGGMLLARAVRPHTAVAGWAPMRVVWHDPDWDVAVLTVVNTERRGFQPAAWLAPASPDVTLAGLDMRAEQGCEAVGFPDSSKQTAPDGDTVRQSEHVTGTLLPAGQAKPPVDLGRILPPAWMPFDVDTRTPVSPDLWGGMSGCGVVLPDQRLVGITVHAHAAEPRRLYVVAIEAVAKAAPGLLNALAEAGGRERATVEHRFAADFRDVLKPTSVGADGAPANVGDVGLGEFGVKPADVPKQPTYLPYVCRDLDEELRDAMVDAVNSARLLLVVGASASGKSRSAAEAAKAVLSEYRFLRPQTDRLDRVEKLPRVETKGCLVWLDDVEKFRSTSFPDQVRRLLLAGYAIVATIRRHELERLTPGGDLRDPTGDALTDDGLVHRVDWLLNWTDPELKRLESLVDDRPLIVNARLGTPPSVYAIAGPELRTRARSVQSDDEHPVRKQLIQALQAWHLTGTHTQVDGAILDEILPSDPKRTADEVWEALEFGLTPVITYGRGSRQAMVSEDSRGYVLNDYLIDNLPSPAVGSQVWATAQRHASDYDDVFRIGYAAALIGNRDVAEDCWKPFAARGILAAQFNLGLLLRRANPPDLAGSRHWYAEAAEQGHAPSQTALGDLLRGQDPPDMWGARRWYLKAALQGDKSAQGTLGALLFGWEPPDRIGARRWLGAAAEQGDMTAQLALGYLLEAWSPPDLEGARRWYLAAASQGDEEAAACLLRLEDRA